MRSRSCPTCHGIGRNPNCVDEWHGPQPVGTESMFGSEFKPVNDDTIFEPDPEFHKRLAALQDASITLTGSFEGNEEALAALGKRLRHKRASVGCPTCDRYGWTFGCQDPKHDEAMEALHMSDPLDQIFRSIHHNHSRDDGCDPNCPMYTRFEHDRDHKTHGGGCGPGCKAWFYLSPQVEDADFIGGEQGYNDDGVHSSVHTRPDPNAQLEKWADVAMWEAPPDPDPQSGPRVTLISMTPIPVQVMAAAAALYRGEIVRDPRCVSMEEALKWLRQTQLSRASQSQLEFVDIHFLIENVTRAFTHQLVRQRVGATYVQESLRFAVKGNAAFEIALPPFFDNLKDDHPLRIIWNRAVAQNSWAYNAMVDGGVPAEDARGLLPTNITTRIHYKTTLRGLVEHAGLRLCSQAQHEWKQVWDGFITAIMEYGPENEQWQQMAIASLFRPVCYNTGKCEFMGASDRHCPIRDRVQAHHAKGEGQEHWVDIHPLEALRYGAARVSPDVANG